MSETLAQQTKERKADRYARAVQYLTNACKKSTREIVLAWRSWNTHPAGCLFAPAVRDLAVDDRDMSYVGIVTRPDGRQCGCLTQIRLPGGRYVAWTDALTEAIRADARIPSLPHEVKVEHLEAFAEWQRRLDKELRDRAA